MDVNDLSAQLKDGLHEANVRTMLKMANALAKESVGRLPFYVLASIFGDLDDLWADQPVEASQVTAAERDLAPAVRQVIFCVQRSAPPNELLEAMDELVARFTGLRDSGDLG